MSNKKQTSVEFLVEKFSKQGTFYYSDINQAKEMEKQQIFEAIDFGYKLEDISITKEEYYTETYEQ